MTDAENAFQKRDDEVVHYEREIFISWIEMFKTWLFCLVVNVDSINDGGVVVQLMLTFEQVSMVFVAGNHPEHLIMSNGSLEYKLEQQIIFNLLHFFCHFWMFCVLPTLVLTRKQAKYNRKRNVLWNYNNSKWINIIRTLNVETKSSDRESNKERKKSNNNKNERGNVHLELFCSSYWLLWYPHNNKLHYMTREMS